MKSAVKIILKFLVFVAISGFFFIYISSVIAPNWGVYTSKIEDFYAQPRNTLDVLYLGGSSFMFGIQPMSIWESFGITGFNLSTAAQPPLASYYYILESLKYQHPKVIVIEGISLYKSYNFDESESTLRFAVDPMHLSKEKIKLIYEITSSSKTQKLSDYLFPLIRFHSRWNEISQEDFEYYKLEKYVQFKGGLPRILSKPIIFPENYMQQTNNVEPYNKSSLAYMEKIIQLCQDNKIEILIATLPRVGWSYSKYLGVKALAEKYNLRFIDFNLKENLDAVNLNPKSDFTDPVHLNFNGAKKVSIHLGAFINNNFSFMDKRKQRGFESWEVDLTAYKSFH